MVSKREACLCLHRKRITGLAARDSAGLGKQWWALHIPRRWTDWPDQSLSLGRRILEGLNIPDVASHQSIRGSPVQAAGLLLARGLEAQTKNFHSTGLFGVAGRRRFCRW
jgi:hypothetical protein